jgi:hypothetical protein
MRTYGFHHPDQQTVKVRQEKLKLAGYLQERKLDFFISADMTLDLQKWREEEGLLDRLNDGE